MRVSTMTILLSGIGLFGYLAAEQMSPEGIAMAIGLLFGIMSTVPGMMMIAAAQRRTDEPPPQQKQPPRVVVVQVEQRKAPETWRVVEDVSRETMETKYVQGEINKDS